MVLILWFWYKHTVIRTNAWGFLMNSMNWRVAHDTVIIGNQ